MFIPTSFLCTPIIYSNSEYRKSTKMKKLFSLVHTSEMQKGLVFSTSPFCESERYRRFITRDLRERS